MVIYVQIYKNWRRSFSCCDKNRKDKFENKIAICGYHGWHDWYLSVNLNGKKLDTHLSKNLNIEGVDKNLKNSTVSFNHNDLVFKKVVTKNKDIGVVIMEVERFEEVNIDFLRFIRNYTKKII